MNDTVAGDEKGRITGCVLALAGWLPFGFLSVHPLFPDGLVMLSGEALFALKAYAAVILSFLGGIGWGLALTSNPDRRSSGLVTSVLPSLVGWALVFVEAPLCFLLFAVAFAAQGFLDWRGLPATEAPGWFSQLRLVLSVLVTLTLLVAWAVY